MNITKQYITENLIRADGKLNNRKITEDMMIEDLYLIYNDIQKPTCQNNHYLIFNSFSKGYKTSCEDKECTKKRAYNNRKLDYTSIHEKVKKTKLKKYGNEHYVNVKKRKETRSENKLNGTQYSRSPIKNAKKLNRDFIIKNFILDDKLNKLEFMRFYDCKETFMYKKLIEFNIEYKRKFSHIENEISKLINEVVMNTRQIIRPLELDIYSKENNFAIEYDGLMWHSYGKSKHSMFDNYREEAKKKHLNKTELCEEKGIQLYHIFENEWLDKNKKEIWISMIKDKQGLNTKIGARKCTIKEVSTEEAKEFIDDNHMQGYINASIKIGLYYNNILISIMTFGKSRYNKNIEYELIRFCTKKGYTIQGGGSKILKYFEKTYKPKSLISYANRRWSMGNFYIKSGFTFKEDTVPNYFYFHPKENILWSRNKFQKHKLSSILENFNKDDTETINMYNNGYRKIYDCGNKVFIKEY